LAPYFKVNNYKTKIYSSPNQIKPQQQKLTKNVKTIWGSNEGTEKLEVNL